MRISDGSSYVCSSDLRLTAERTDHVDFSAHAAGLHDLREIAADHFDDMIPSGPAGDLAYLCPPVGGLGIIDDVAGPEGAEIGSASCRERVGQYVWIPVVAVPLKKKQQDSQETI